MTIYDALELVESKHFSSLKVLGSLKSDVGISEKGFWEKMGFKVVETKGGEYKLEKIIG